ncbi:MAG: hypothetical protein EA001_05810 [Oscillatoriales cyanobacterium]|nr:MAG: hypothetical protein EA001_05810 [Oscillatoriales cyanobacterium]
MGVIAHLAKFKVEQLFRNQLAGRAVGIRSIRRDQDAIVQFRKVPESRAIAPGLRYRAFGL